MNCCSTLTSITPEIASVLANNWNVVGEQSWCTIHWNSGHILDTNVSVCSASRMLVSRQCNNNVSSNDSISIFNFFVGWSLHSVVDASPNRNVLHATIARPSNMSLVNEERFGIDRNAMQADSTTFSWTVSMFSKHSTKQETTSFSTKFSLVLLSLFLWKPII